MKKLLYSLIILVGFSACQEDDERLDFLSNPENRGTTYYSFDDAAGDTVAIVEGSSGSVRIESPLKLQGTVVLEISISGPDADAIGADVTLSNSTTVGGVPINELSVEGSVITVKIQNRDTIQNLPMFIGVDIADNIETQDTRYVTFTLTNAYIESTGQELGVGDLSGELASVVVALSDDDCESTLSGTYTSINCFPDPATTVTWAEDADINGVYQVSDFTGGYYGYAGVPTIALEVTEKCGLLSAEDFDAFGVLHFRDISGTVNADGSISLNWSEINFDPISCSTSFVEQ